MTRKEMMAPAICLGTQNSAPFRRDHSTIRTRRFLRPPSRSSAETTWAFTRTEPRTMSFRICLTLKSLPSPLSGRFLMASMSLAAFFSRASNSSLFQIAAVYELSTSNDLQLIGNNLGTGPRTLMTSASPLMNSLSGRLFKKLRSM